MADRKTTLRSGSPSMVTLADPLGPYRAHTEPSELNSRVRVVPAEEGGAIQVSAGEGSFRCGAWSRIFTPAGKVRCVVDTTTGVGSQSS